MMEKFSFCVLGLAVVKEEEEDCIELGWQPAGKSKSCCSRMEGFG